MKFAVKIVLIIFIAFLATPTIVSLIERKSDKIYFYDLSEEEDQNDYSSIKEIKCEFIFSTDYSFIGLSAQKSSLILSENLSKHDNISAVIFTPPPEQA